MHSKRLGTLGEMKVATFLLERGYSVFSELGDISRKDLILEVENKLKSIQVKSCKKTKFENYSFKNCKSGPNYQYRYGIEDVDIFALYCVDDDKIAWMTSKEFIEAKGSVTLRSTPSKNGQILGVNMLEDFLDVTRVLRDHEQNNLLGNAKVEDMVQTTTTAMLADESQSSK